jgi:hypothetical protein
MRRVVIVDDNHTIQVWLYEADTASEGVAAGVTPQRALHIAQQLIDAALRHMHNQEHPLVDPATGIKLSC